MLKSSLVGNSLAAQWLRLLAPSAGGLGVSPGQGTRSHMSQLKISCAIIKIQYRKPFKKKKLLGQDQSNPYRTEDKRRRKEFSNGYLCNYQIFPTLVPDWILSGIRIVDISDEKRGNLAKSMRANRGRGGSFLLLLLGSYAFWVRLRQGRCL